MMTWVAVILGIGFIGIAAAETVYLPGRPRAASMHALTGVAWLVIAFYQRRIDRDNARTSRLLEETERRNADTARMIQQVRELRTK